MIMCNVHNFSIHLSHIKCIEVTPVFSFWSLADLCKTDLPFTVQISLSYQTKTMNKVANSAGLSSLHLCPAGKPPASSSCKSLKKQAFSGLRLLTF